MPMVLEEWPGGRWFRDLGSGQGHLWGFVQVIKPPTLIEIQGPMFMSYPVAGHVQLALCPAELARHFIEEGTVIGLHTRGIGEGNTTDAEVGLTTDGWGRDGRLTGTFRWLGSLGGRWLAAEDAGYEEHDESDSYHEEPPLPGHSSGASPTTTGR